MDTRPVCIREKILITYIQECDENLKLRKTQLAPVDPLDPANLGLKNLDQTDLGQI